MESLPRVIVRVPQHAHIGPEHQQCQQVPIGRFLGHDGDSSVSGLEKGYQSLQGSSGLWWKLPCSLHRENALEKCKSISPFIWESGLSMVSAPHGVCDFVTV